MGGPAATDDLAMGYLTQTWLAVSTDAAATVSGGYWYHRQRQEPAPQARDPDLQDQLMGRLAALTGLALLNATVASGQILSQPRHRRLASERCAADRRIEMPTQSIGISRTGRAPVDLAQRVRRFVGELHRRDSLHGEPGTPAMPGRASPAVAGPYRQRAVTSPVRRAG